MTPNDKADSKGRSGLTTLRRFARWRYVEPILVGLLSVAIGAGGMAIWQSWGSMARTTYEARYEARTAYVDALLRDYREEYAALEEFRTSEIEQYVREELYGNFNKAAFEGGNRYGRALWFGCASGLAVQHRGRCSPGCEEIDFVMLLAKVGEMCGGSSVYKGATKQVRTLWDEAATTD